MSYTKRGCNFQPLEVQALLKACIVYNVEEKRLSGESISHLFYDISTQMAEYGNFPERKLYQLRAYYLKTHREYKSGRKPFPPEARILWGAPAGETDASENDSAWKVLAESRQKRKLASTSLIRNEIVEVISLALERNIESLSEEQQQEAFGSILKVLHSKKLFQERNATDLHRAYNSLRNRFLKGKNPEVFPKSASKLWDKTAKIGPKTLRKAKTIVEDKLDKNASRNQDVSNIDVKDVEIEEIDAENVCSICRAHAIEMKHLFRDVYQNQTYAEIINQTLNVKMLWNGQSSAMICQICATYIEGIPIFWRQCQEGSNRLNVCLVTKEEPQLQEPVSGAGTSLPDYDADSNSGCADFLSEDFPTDAIDEKILNGMLNNMQNEIPIAINENNSIETQQTVDTQDNVDEKDQPTKTLTREEQNYLKFKKSRGKRHIYKRKPMQCELCGKTVFDIKSHLDSQFHRNSQSSACHLCPRKFNSRHQLREHLNTHTRERTFPCSYCKVVFDSWTGRKRHEERHYAEINNISYDCDQCDATFRVERNLKNHVKFKHLGIRHLHCNICDFSTKIKLRLLNHVRSLHSKERPYKCPYCGFQSNSNTGYFIHFKRHKSSGEAKSYHMQCSYCSEDFVKDAALEVHIRESHPDKAIKV